MPRKTGSTQNKINYKLKIRNILEDRFIDAGEFATHEDIANFLKTKNINYTKMAIQKISQNQNNEFFQIIHV